jgi:hypothetical protein
MEQSYTSISDLPVDGKSQSMNNQGIIDIPSTISISNSKTSKISGETPTNYIPINVHQNPYGVSDQNPISEFGPQNSSHIDQTNPTQQLPEQYHEQLNNMKHQRLPSRDIPQDTMSLVNDEQIQPNYIPRSDHHSDYVRDHENMTDISLREYNRKKRRHSLIDQILTELQTPLFITIIFFMFQLPIVNNMIFKQIPMLSLHNSDGNFNLNGLIIKSIMFGGFYYSSSSIITFISEL